MTNEEVKERLKNQIKKLEDLQKVGCIDFFSVIDYHKSILKELERLEKLEKVIEILKKNLIVKVDEGANNKDVSCLVIVMETIDNKLAILYETFDEEKIKLLKEVFGNE